jgi:hypothetical protein
MRVNINDRQNQRSTLLSDLGCPGQLETGVGTNVRCTDLPRRARDTA